MLSLGAEAVVGVVAVVSPQNQGLVYELLTAHQIAQTVIAVVLLLPLVSVML